MAAASHSCGAGIAHGRAGIPRGHSRGLAHQAQRHGAGLAANATHREVRTAGTRINQSVAAAQNGAGTSLADGTVAR